MKAKKNECRHTLLYIKHGPKAEIHGLTPEMQKKIKGMVKD